MKATVDIPDDIYRLTRIRAAEEGDTIRSLIVRGLRKELGLDVVDRQKPPPLEVDEEGWPVRRLSVPKGERVTDELVNRLREKEGV